jgi:hypothetical protein
MVARTHTGTLDLQERTRAALDIPRHADNPTARKLRENRGNRVEPSIRDADDDEKIFCKSLEPLYPESDLFALG